MLELGLRGVNYAGTEIPPQAIPTNAKNKIWQHACMDAMENIGVRQISENHARFNDSYRIVEGDFKYKDVMKSSLFLTEVDFLRSQADVDTDMQHYGFIEPIVNQLVGEYIKKPNALIIDANDSFSTSDYIKAKTDRLWESVSKDLDNRINKKLKSMGLLPTPEFQSEEEAQAYEQNVQQVTKSETPSEIETDMNQNWRGVYIDWAEATIEEDYNRFDIDEIDRECLNDYMITGRCFKHFRVGADYYQPERWHPKQTFCDLTQRDADSGDYIGYISNISANRVIANFGHKLSERDKKALTNSVSYKSHIGSYNKANGIKSTKQWIEKGGGDLHQIPHSSYFDMQNASYLQDLFGVDLGRNGTFPNGNQRLNYFDMSSNSGRHDLIRIIEAYWVSQQRIGHLTLEDPNTGEPVTEIVTDEILSEYLTDNEIKRLTTVTLEQHEHNPQINTIVWDYQPQVWTGVKICKENTELKDDLYIGVEPLSYQLKGESQTYHTRLPVAGLVEQNSFVSRLEEDQKDYNIARNSMRDYMGKELGVFYAMDFTYLPSWLKDMGGEDSMMELFDIVRELGILPADGSNTKSRFNQFAAVDMDLTRFMAQKLDLAKAIKYEALEKVGLTLSRMGTPSSQETATGVTQSVNASYAQTETWFDKFAKFQKKSAEIHLNVAQYMKKEGVDGTVNYVDSDKIRKFLNMSDPYLPMRRFRITLENNAKRRGELELIKQVYLNDNTIDKNIEAVAEVVTSDSISKILEAGRHGRKIAEAQQQQAALQQQEAIKLKEAATTEREAIKHQYQLQLTKLKGEIDLRKQTILAMGFAEDKDINNNKIPDVIEEAKFALDELKTNLDNNNKQADRLDKKLQSERDNRYKEAELDLKRKEIDVRKYTADKTLEVAKENKTKSEISKNKKSDK